jgi:hypothetical protein
MAMKLIDLLTCTTGPLVSPIRKIKNLKVLRLHLLLGIYLEFKKVILYITKVYRLIELVASIIKKSRAQSWKLVGKEWRS